MRKFYEKNKILVFLLVAGFFVFFSMPAYSQSDPFYRENCTEVPVGKIKFARGKSSAMVSGSLPAYGFKTYSLGARKGQKMTLTLHGKEVLVRVMSYEQTKWMVNKAGKTKTTATFPVTGSWVELTVATCLTDLQKPSRYRLTVSIK
jgi:hypothetical protein